MRRSIALVPALFLIGAAAAMIPGSLLAATAPTYQQAGPKGGAGWATQALPDGRYVVSYTGDSRMKKDQVAKFAFLRAAEFTQEQGFEWFAVLSSKVRDVEIGSADDMAGRTGNFIGGDSAGTGTGVEAGGGSGTVDMGPSTGGFGGGAAPPGVDEHWQPKKVTQAVLIIQMGKGDQAQFPGVAKQPEIFDAKSTIAELRAQPAN